MSSIGTDPEETASWLERRGELDSAELVRQLGTRARNLDLLEEKLIELINHDRTPPVIGHMITGLMALASSEADQT